MAEAEDEGAPSAPASSKLRQIMALHVAAVLNAGVSVVPDFPANTVAQRGWMRAILETTTAAHQLHLLDVPDEVCLTRLRSRNSQGDHPFALAEVQFRRFSSHFVAPTRDECISDVRHDDCG